MAKEENEGWKQPGNGEGRSTGGTDTVKRRRHRYCLCQSTPCGDDTERGRGYHSDEDASLQMWAFPSPSPSVRLSLVGTTTTAQRDFIRTVAPNGLPNPHVKPSSVPKDQEEAHVFQISAKHYFLGTSTPNSEG